MVITIDGKQYGIRLLTGGINSSENNKNEWDLLMDAFNEDNELLNWYGMCSWCQDKVYGLNSERVLRGWYSARYGSYHYASYAPANSGFRPVLEPIDRSELESILDGTIMQLGTLYMDGKALKNPKNPVIEGDITRYISGLRLKIGDSSSNTEELIRWVKWNGLLVADRNILRDATWNQLNENFLFEDMPKNNNKGIKTDGYPEYIMQSIRNSLHLYRNDTSRDNEIKDMSKDTIFYNVCRQYGIDGHVSLIKSLAKDIYGYEACEEVDNVRVQEAYEMYSSIPNVEYIAKSSRLQLRLFRNLQNQIKNIEDKIASIEVQIEPGLKSCLAA